jgi:hypothetical protein
MRRGGEAGTKGGGLNLMLLFTAPIPKKIKKKRENEKKGVRLAGGYERSNGGKRKEKETLRKEIA